MGSRRATRVTPPEPRELDFVIHEAASLNVGRPARSESWRHGRFRFRLAVYPKGASGSYARYVSAFVEADPPGCLCSEWRFEDVVYSITMVNWGDPRRSKVRTGICTFSANSSDGWAGHPKFILRSELWSGGWLGPDGEMHFRATATVDVPEEEWEAMLDPTARAAASLPSDLRALLSSCWQGDVTLRAADGGELVAHRLVLAARSPILKELLTTGDAGNAKGHIDMPELDSDTLGRLCQYLYSGTVEYDVWCDDNAARTLLKAAARYGLVDLKELCEAWARRRVDVRTVADWLRAAVEASAHALRRHCLRTIAENLPAVQEEDGWERLMSDNHLLGELAPDLLREIGTRMKQPRPRRHPWGDQLAGPGPKRARLER